MTNELSLYLAILRRRLWMIVLLFAVTMIVVLIGALSAKPVYESAIRLQVIPTEAEQVTLYSPARTVTGDNVELTAFQFGQSVRGSKAARQTINQLGLSLSPDELIKRTTLYQEYGFVTVVVSAESPEAAAATATALVENALTIYRADQSRPAVVQGEFIAEQLSAAEQAYAKAQAELLRFKLSHTVDALDSQIAAYQNRVRDLRARREDAVLDEVQLKARSAALTEEAKAAADAAASAAQGSAERDAAQGRAAALRQTLSTLRGELASAQAAQVEYDRAIARWETDLTALIGLSDEYARLTDAVQQARNTHAFLFNKSLEAQLKQRQGLSVGYLKVIDPARRSEQPLSGNWLRIALVGGILSIVLGTLLAFIFEFLGRRPAHAGA